MLGCIKSRELTEEQKVEFEAIMAKAQPIIRQAAEKKLKTDNPSIREFRRLYAKNALGKLSNAVVTAMESIRDIEYPVMEGYCRVVPELVKPFYHAHKAHHRAVDFEDFVQEGLTAISDCMFTYRPNTRFTTYACNSIHNRMIDYVRSDHFLTSVKKRILKIMPEFRSLLDSGLSVDEVAKKLNLSEDDKQDCVAAMAEAVNGPEVGWENFVSDYDFNLFEGEIRMDVEEVREAIKNAGLSELEEDAFYTVINGGTKTSVSEKHGVSRMASTYAYERALSKIKGVVTKAA